MLLSAAIWVPILAGALVLALGATAVSVAVGSWRPLFGS